MIEFCYFYSLIIIIKTHSVSEILHYAFCILHSYNVPTQFRNYSLFAIISYLERSEHNSELRITHSELDNTLCHHSICNLNKACYVSTCNEVITKAVFFSSCCRMVMNIFHNLLKSCVNFFGSPVVSH